MYEKYSWQWMVVMALALVLAGQGLHAAERRTFEAEEFDGLKRFAYTRDHEPGWYAREGTCRKFGAAGKGYFAMIHEGAKNRVAVKTIKQAVPAGQYQVFITSCGLYWADKTNIVKVRIGDAESTIEWGKDKKSNKFIWLKGTNITLAKPATRLELEAAQFGGKGYAHLYETSTRSIPVDQIYITSDLTEKTGPSIQGFHVTMGDRDAAATVVAQYDKDVYRKVNMQDSVNPEGPAQHTPVLLRGYDGRKNLWPNSSFELGGQDGWASNSAAAGGTHIFSERDHIQGGVQHGQYCMRLPGKQRQYSRAVMLPEDGTYTLSAYARHPQGKGKARIAIVPLTMPGRKLGKDALSTDCALSGEWQRFSATGALKAGLLVLAVTGACDLDALQLEAGDKATAYAPRATMEACLATPHVGNILHVDKGTALTAWAHNAGDKDGEASLQYRIVDVRERVIVEAAVAIPVPAGKTVKKTVAVPRLHGLFSALYSAHGGLKATPSHADGELVYCVLPPLPQSMPRHALACSMDNVEAVHELMARMGHKWQLYCKLYMDKPTKLNPKPGEYNWDAARKVLTMAAKHGMKTMPCLWPNRASEHLKDPAMSSLEAYADKRDITRMVKHRVPTFPDLDKWSEYCKQVALHLGDDLPWWTIDDETEMYYSPREFARITRATVKGFKASGKTMKVSHSCIADYMEEVLAEMGGDIGLGGFGSSSYDYEYWDARKVRYLQKRYNLPWFCIGVGGARSPQFHHAFSDYKGVYGSAVQTAQKMVLLALVQDARVIGHYTGRMWMRGALRNTDYPLMDYDGTPLAHGFSYSCIPLLVADAEPVEDVYLDRLRTVVLVFRQDGKLGACTWANNFPGLDIHWKTEPRVWRDCTLPGAANKVQVTGMYGNPRQGVKTQGGDVVLDLGEEPCFVFDRSMGEAAFLQMIKGIAAKPRELEMRLAFVPDGQGGVDLGVRVHNTTDKAVTGLKLDANFPPNRMLSRVSWMLPERTGVMPAVPAKGTAWGRVPTIAGLDFPIENATLTAWVTDGQGREHAMYDTCWLTVAPQVACTVDGRSQEWDAVQPAWMYYTFSWARFGRHNVQFEKNAEHFKYVWRTDARAAVYTGHDEKNLYVNLVCEDDDLVASGGTVDALEIHVNAKPGETEGTKVYSLSFKDGELHGPAGVKMAWSKRQAKGYHEPSQDITVWTCEAAIPLAAIGVKPDTGNAMGFDVVWHDADHDGKAVVTGTWRWAGRSTSLGTLFFK